jgi:hypothetical protein
MLHKHKCSHCNLIWEHPDPESVEYKSEAEYAEQHACPGCGKDQRRKYYSNDEPNVAHCVQVEGAINGHFERPPTPPPIILELLGLLADLDEAAEEFKRLDDRRFKRLDNRQAA